MTTKPLEVRLTIWQFFEYLWPILYYLGGPLLALSSGSSRIYRKSTDKLLCEVCSLSPFYGLKLQIKPHPTRCHYPLMTYLRGVVPLLTLFSIRWIKLDLVSWIVTFFCLWTSTSMNSKSESLMESMHKVFHKFLKARLWTSSSIRISPKLIWLIQFKYSEKATKT